jgi:hypothetical protein
VAEKLGKKGNVAILLGSLTSPEHQGRVQGFKKAIGECPNMKIVFEQPDNDNLEQAVSVTEGALQAHPDLNAILCCNASNPIGAARAVKNAGKTGKILIGGFDDPLHDGSAPVGDRLLDLKVSSRDEQRPDHPSGSRYRLFVGHCRVTQDRGEVVPWRTSAATRLARQ